VFGPQNLGDRRVVGVGAISLGVQGARIQEQGHAPYT
jgi:hypothetical protein